MPPSAARRAYHAHSPHEHMTMLVSLFSPGNNTDRGGFVEGVAADPIIESQVWFRRDGAGLAGRGRGEINSSPVTGALVTPPSGDRALARVYEAQNPADTTSQSVFGPGHYLVPQATLIPGPTGAFQSYQNGQTFEGYVRAITWGYAPGGPVNIFGTAAAGTTAPAPAPAGPAPPLPPQAHPPMPLTPSVPPRPIARPSPMISPPSSPPPEPPPVSYAIPEGPAGQSGQ